MDVTDFKDNFQRWLLRLSKAEKPGLNVIAFNIGLFETEDGYSAYLIGSDRFDENDFDWACDEVFSPKERYFPIALNEPLGWEQLHRKVVESTKTFLDSTEGSKSFLSSASALTVGFDDADLDRIL